MCRNIPVSNFFLSPNWPWLVVGLGAGDMVDFQFHGTWWHKLLHGPNQSTHRACVPIYMVNWVIECAGNISISNFFLSPDRPWLVVVVGWGGYMKPHSIAPGHIRCWTDRTMAMVDLLDPFIWTVGL